MSTITYQVEHWADIEEELKPFAEVHWRELGRNYQEIPLDLDWEKYKQLDAMGILHVTTVRLDGELIGYAVMIVQGHLHYKSTLHAFEDLYFVKKEHRKGRIGIKLFSELERHLKEKGVKKIIMGTKVYSDNSKLLEHFDYKCTEKVYTKLI